MKGKHRKGGKGGGGGGGNRQRSAQVRFAASAADVNAVKFWAAGRVNDLSTVHLSYDDVEDMLRIPNDDEMALAFMELVGESDEAMEFIASAVKKRNLLIHGKGAGMDEEGGVVAYKKETLGVEKVQMDKPQFVTKVVVEDPEVIERKKQEEKRRKKQEKEKMKKIMSEREECYCMGLEHPVITNCLSCGKVICKHEGIQYPCTFCGAAVEAEGDVNDSSLKEAISRRNALLDYEKRSVARSMIYDDQADYFNSESQWISQKEREKLKEKEREIRDKKKVRAMRIAVDIFGRRMVVTQDDANTNVYEPFNLKEILMTKEEEEQAKQAQQQQQQPKQKAQAIPAYVLKQGESQKKPSAGPKAAAASTSGHRIQHQYFEVEQTEDLEEETRRSYNLAGLCCLGGNAASSLPVPIVKPLQVIVDANDETLKDVAPDSIIRSFDMADASNLPKIEARLAANIGHTLLDFTRVLAAPEGFNGTLARFHGETVSNIVGKAPKSSWLVMVQPLHGNVSDPQGIPQDKRKYLNELHSVCKSPAIVFLLSVSRPIVNKEFCSEVADLFKGDSRRFALLDKSLEKASMGPCFHPYSGRFPDLPIEGLFVQPHSATSALARPANLTLKTSFDYLRNARSYDPLASLVFHLQHETNLDQRERHHWLQVLPLLPTYLHPIFDAKLLRKQMSSRPHLEALSDSVAALRQSQRFQAWIGPKAWKSFEQEALNNVSLAIEKQLAPEAPKKPEPSKQEPTKQQEPKKQPQQQQQQQKPQGEGGGGGGRKKKHNHPPKKNKPQ